MRIGVSTEAFLVKNDRSTTLFTGYNTYDCSFKRIYFELTPQATHNDRHSLMPTYSLTAFGDPVTVQTHSYSQNTLMSELTLIILI